LVHALSLHRVSADEAIMKEGEDGDFFYIIKEGSVIVTQQQKEIRKMYRGEFFGEQALLYNC
jgi:cGMP-dependent protein kinase